VSALVLAMIGGSPAWAADPSPSPTAPGTAGSISGTVTVQNGASAEGVQVIANIHNTQWNGWMWQQAATVGADGTYTLSNLPDGDYRIDFRSGSSSTSVLEQWWQGASDVWSGTTVTVSGGAAVTGIDASLSPAASISGTVTDESGNPVFGAFVTATDPVTHLQVGYANADPSGAYRIVGLPAGSFVIHFQPGYITGGNLAEQWWQDASSSTAATPVAVATAQDVSSIDAVLHPAGSITGVVTDTTGAPAANILVAVYRSTTDGSSDWVTTMGTDPSTGSYTVSGLPAGSYKVLFSSGGPLLSQWYDNAPDAASATPVVVTVGGSTTADAVLQVGATVSGVVTDQAGHPVSNATVLVHPANGQGYATGATTASDGSYSIAGLAPGSYKVEFQTDQATPNVAPAWWNGAVTEAVATPLTLAVGQVVTGISPRLAAGGAITGTLRDDKGAPLMEAQVAVYDSSGTWVQNAWTAPDGSYNVHGLAAGKYRLQFIEQLADYSTLYEWWNNASTLATARPLNVVAGKTQSGIDATIALSDHSLHETRSGSISGVVRDALGQPLSGISVVVAGDTFGDVTLTDASGAWSMTNMPAGTYRVSFAGQVGGVQTTQWWQDAATSDAATPITLVDAQQRTGVDAVLGAGALPPLRSSQPTVTGSATVGSMLKAHARGWTGGTQFAYEWFADGFVVPNAASDSLIVTPDLVGKRVTVEVTGSLPGYQSIVQTSAPTAPVQAR
jgi:5-hydroxyisourate hydrolase-like protein (transthyretin family)